MQDCAHFTATQLVRAGFYIYLKSSSVFVVILYKKPKTYRKGMRAVYCDRLCGSRIFYSLCIFIVFYLNLF
jgi:hypothetical protein